MNKQDLIRLRNENMKCLDPTVKPHKNSVAFKIKGETPEHFLKKAISSYCVRRGVPPDCLIPFFESPAMVKRIGSLVTRMESFCDFNGMDFKNDWERPVVLSEARMDSGAVFDLYVSDTGQRIEIVHTCSDSVVKYDDDTIVIRS